MYPHPSVEATQCNPHGWVSSPCWGPPFQWVAIKIALAFSWELGAAGSGFPALEECTAQAHAAGGTLAGRGKRGSRNGGRRADGNSDQLRLLIYFKIKQMAAAGVCLSSAPGRTAKAELGLSQNFQ